MSLAKIKDNQPPKRRRRRTKPPKMAGKPRTFAVQPCGDIDYAALCSDVNQRFPHILQRLAE